MTRIILTLALSFSILVSPLSFAFPKGNQKCIQESSFLSPPSIFASKEPNTNPTFAQKLKWILTNHKRALISTAVASVAIGGVIQSLEDQKTIQALFQVFCVLPWGVGITYYGDILAKRGEAMKKNAADPVRRQFMRWVSVFNAGLDFTFFVFLIGPLTAKLVPYFFGTSDAPYAENGFPFRSIMYVLDTFVYIPVSYLVLYFVKAFFNPLRVGGVVESAWSQIKPKKPGLKGFFLSGGWMSTTVAQWGVSVLAIPTFLFVPLPFFYIIIALSEVIGAIIFALMFNASEEEDHNAALTREEIKSLLRIQSLKDRALAFEALLKGKSGAPRNIIRLKMALNIPTLTLLAEAA